MLSNLISAKQLELNKALDTATIPYKEISMLHSIVICMLIYNF